MTFRLDILTFHRIMADGSLYFIPPMAMSVRSFAALMQRLAKTRRVTKLENAIEAGSINGRTVAITFDDGYLDNFETARPILLKMGLPATFFIPVTPIELGRAYWWDHLHFIATTHGSAFRQWLKQSALLANAPSRDTLMTTPESTTFCRELVRQLNAASDGTRSDFLTTMEKEFGPHDGERLLMNWEEVRQLHKEGFDIGSHTLSHIPLTDLPPSDAEREIRQSRNVLAEKIHGDVRGFCYPRGQCKPEHEAMAHSAGYTYAVSTRFGSNGADCAPFSLCRRNMSDYQGVRSLFPVTMHMIELSGKLDSLLAKRRSG